MTLSPTQRREALDNEEWRDIPEHIGYYEISNFGRIRSLKRFNGRALVDRKQPKLLRMSPNAHGYFDVILSVRKKKTNHRVHKLVLLAFHGPRPEGKEAAHLNGNQLDNRADNLRWVTAEENAAHKKLHGTHIFGSKQKNSKLSDEKVKEIFRLKALGKPGVFIARKFNVSDTVISSVLHRRSWKHVALAKGDQP